MVRSSVPEASPVQRAQVDSALRRVCDRAADGLPEPWQRAVREAAFGRSGDVRDALDRAVVGTDLGVDRVPLWWRLAGAVQWLLVLATVVGAVWLGLLAFGTYLRLPDLPTPEVSGIAVPSLLLVGGLLLGLLLAMIGRVIARAGARVRRRRAESRLRTAIESVADPLMIAPVEEELARHRRAREALERAGARAAADSPAADVTRVVHKQPIAASCPQIATTLWPRPATPRIVSGKRGGHRPLGRQRGGHRPLGDSEAATGRWDDKAAG
jgi:plasmid stabilization system protein ParE